MKIGTLGPTGTNSELAAKAYLDKLGKHGTIILYETPEQCIEELKSGNIDSAILCVVYPKLNNIVFQNLEAIHMSDVFFFPTDDMVIAGNIQGTRACTHPAPVNLLGNVYDIHFVNSNADAAIRCANGEFDLCVTTRSAATMNALDIVRNHGPVNMGWSIFVNKFSTDKALAS